MRLAAAAALALLVSNVAEAGGLGLLFSGGTHTEKVYYYSNHLYPDGDTGAAVPIENARDYVQYNEVQTLPQVGTGVELILGGRNDAITGVFRFYFQRDAAQANPADGNASVRPEDVVVAYRDRPNDVGMGMVGLNWLMVGPEKFRVGMNGFIGSGFLTKDHGEFLAYHVGPTVKLTLNRQLAVFADVGYQGRVRKTFSHGVVGNAGVRYMFD